MLLPLDRVANQRRVGSWQVEDKAVLASPAMARRPPLNLEKLAAEQHARRAASGTNDPTGIQWFVDIRFEEPGLSRDGGRIRQLLDGLASTRWFGEFDVFAAGHKRGVAFENLDEVQAAIAGADRGTIIFAHGEPRMTLDVHEAEAALALDFTTSMLELRLWFGVRPVAQYKRAVLDDVIALLLALREAWADSMVAKGQAFPDPIDSVRYRRTRPQRIANRAMNAVVEVIDRDAPSDGPPWARDASAMAAAPPPPDAQRIERGRLVVLRWLDDPSDPLALAEACSRHEQWLVGVVQTRLAPGWNEDGDREVVDDAKLVEATSEAAWTKPGAAGRGATLVAGSRSDALALAEKARALGFARVVYRDPGGKLWDPLPPGHWVS